MASASSNSGEEEDAYKSYMTAKRRHKEVQDVEDERQRAYDDLLTAKARYESLIAELGDRSKGPTGSSWTLSGPVSCSVHKYNDRTVYIFGDVHTGWQHMCYSTTNPNSATNHLINQRLCDENRSCRFLTTFLKDAGKLAEGRNETVKVYYEGWYEDKKQPPLQIVFAYPMAKAQPLMMLDMFRDEMKKCINRKCGGLEVIPVDIRNTVSLTYLLDMLNGSMAFLKHQIPRILENLRKSTVDNATVKMENLNDDRLKANIKRTYEDLKVAAKTLNETFTTLPVTAKILSGIEMYRNYYEEQNAMILKVVIGLLKEGSPETYTQYSSLDKFVRSILDQIITQEDITTTHYSKFKIGLLSISEMSPELDLEQFSTFIEQNPLIDTEFFMFGLGFGTMFMDICTLSKILASTERCNVIFAGDMHARMYRKFFNLFDDKKRIDIPMKKMQQIITGTPISPKGSPKPPEEMVEYNRCLKMNIPFSDFVAFKVE
jgi:hypothetical protein